MCWTSTGTAPPPATTVVPRMPTITSAPCSMPTDFLIPMWIVESGAYSGDPLPAPISNPPIDYPPQTERQEALDYVKRHVYPLSFGVKKIFSSVGVMEGFR